MTNKACQNCGYLGVEQFCPKCRAKGNIVPLKSRGELERDLQRMRGRAERIKAVIRQMGGA